jgi:hypothetical protein
MATATEPVPAGVETEDRVVDLTSGEFFGMIEAGLFAPERRVFLRGGRVVEKMAKTVPHAFVAARIIRAPTIRSPEGWPARPEDPMILDGREVARIPVREVWPGPGAG